MNPGHDSAPGRRRDWYKVSIETLKGWGIFLLLVFLGAGGYLGYRAWERYALQREAGRVIEESGLLLQQLQGDPELASFQDQFEAGRVALTLARGHLVEERFAEARSEGGRSREILLSVLDAVRNRAGDGEAQFIGVEGRVEFRRGERGEWETARSRIDLRPGDYVKTGTNGSAEIMFDDGTLYTVRPDTLFVVTGTTSSRGREERSISLQYGWVNLNTARSPSRVATPGAEATVGDETEAVVSYDRGDEKGVFTTYRGSMQVASGGVVRAVGELETVEALAGSLGEISSLPQPPALLAPEENASFDLDRRQELVLDWEQVEGARRYALQISRNRLFVDNVIDSDQRHTTEATLGLRGEGTFLWRVAAIDDNDLRGPWSAPQRFRVASFRGEGGARDEEPPDLALGAVQAYGSIFIVNGTSEPGASVWVNEEPVAVQADGSFTKTIQLLQRGWALIELRAADAWGNETTRRHRVYVEGL